jgi:prophage regulatory protein
MHNAVNSTREFLTRQQIEQITGLSRRTINRQIKAGLFPQAIRLTPRNLRWDSLLFQAWLTARSATVQGA